ncbi:T9SS type A sorting domain-containing protein [Ochrovirga pacifica]|uniref:T9SS type A sorting domain-containing protein n=1 Tax=Ochrovirga pacifica TaxID=1042376 RepID=UPI0002559AB7|nr:T9SS type A sorting domain-containing protein [Ochrovirga pacifica]
MRINYILKRSVLALFMCHLGMLAQTTLPVTSGGVNNTVQFSDNQQSSAELNLKVDIEEYYSLTPSYARKVYMHFNLTAINGQTLTAGALKVNFSSSSSATAGSEGITILANAYHGAGLPSSGVPKYSYDFSGFTKTTLGNIFTVAADASITDALGVQTLDILSYLQERANAGDTEVLIEIEVTVDNSSNQRSLFKVSSDAGAVPPTIVVEGPTLSAVKITKSKLDGAYYNTTKQAVMVGQNFQGDFVIFNVLGQKVKEGNVTREVSVSDLKSGVYMFATAKGSLKFVK